MTKEEHVRFWLESSEQDLPVMESLFDKGHFAWALFVGHLVLEKMLKSLYVQNKDITPPFIHHLLKLARETGLTLNVEQEEFLLEVTSYNIRGRYPDFKHALQNKATPEYTIEKITRIKEFRQWLNSLIIR
jgi:HEPN domain-containing protein